MFTVTHTITLDKFDAWGGAKMRLDSLKKHPRAYEYIKDYIDTMLDGATETEINDFIWFDSDYMLQETGYLDDDYECTEEVDF